MNIRSVLAAAVACSTIITMTAGAAELSVPSSQYPKIQDAIDDAVSGDVILVNSGVYNEQISFNGLAIEVRSVNGPASTVIDGSGATGSVVTFANGEGSDSVLHGFTIRGGTGTAYAGITVGGGIYVRNAGPTVVECIIEQNEAKAGGGLGQVGANAALVGCVGRDNTASEPGIYGGGGIYTSFGSLQLHNCEITNNMSIPSAVGGGVSVQFTHMQAINCLFTGNYAGSWGGGTYNRYGSLALINCTVADNEANYGGGGIYSRYPETATSLTNSVVWSNTAGYGFNEIHDHMDAATSITNSNIEWNDNLGDFVASDPMFMDPQTGDYRLVHDSPCVDAGDNDVQVVIDTFDLDGDGNVDELIDLRLESRIFNDTQGVIDLGAFEFQGPTGDPEPDPCTADLSGDGVVNVFDLLDLLAAWGGDAQGATIAEPNNVVDVFDLLDLLDAWGPCPQ